MLKELANRSAYRRRHQNWVGRVSASRHFHLFAVETKSETHRNKTVAPTLNEKCIGFCNALYSRIFSSFRRRKGGVFIWHFAAPELNQAFRSPLCCCLAELCACLWAHPSLLRCCTVETQAVSHHSTKFCQEVCRQGLQNFFYCCRDSLEHKRGHCGMSGRLCGLGGDWRLIWSWQICPEGCFH